jgi:hypothetical protein
VELAPHGASAGVVYYGFVATDMVNKGMEDRLLARLEAHHIPRFVRHRLSPAEAAEVLVRGIERRAPRVFAPFYLQPYSALRGILNPLIDWRLERDAALQALLRESDRGEGAEPSARDGAQPRVHVEDVGRGGDVAVGLEPGALRRLGSRPRPFGQAVQRPQPASDEVAGKRGVRDVDEAVEGDRDTLPDGVQECRVLRPGVTAGPRNGSR